MSRSRRRIKQTIGRVLIEYAREQRQQPPVRVHVASDIGEPIAEQRPGLRRQLVDQGLLRPADAEDAA